MNLWLKTILVNLLILLFLASAWVAWGIKAAATLACVGTGILLFVLFIQWLDN